MQIRFFIRTILFAPMFFMAFVVSSAQETTSHPDFFEQGRYWVTETSNRMSFMVLCVHLVVGDTIVNDRKAAVIQLTSVNHQGETDVSHKVAYEENGIVYVLSGEEFVPCMNINLEVGESLGVYRVTRKEQMRILDYDRKVLTINDGCCYWIEGVGWTEDCITGDLPIGHRTALLKCYSPEEGCIFRRYDIDQPISGISEIAVDTQRPVIDEIYDINGRRVTNPRAGQVYIRGNRKIIWQ